MSHMIRSLDGGVLTLTIDRPEARNALDTATYRALAGAVEGDSPGIALLRALAGFGKPLVAAVEGVAVGIGSTMLLHCDFAWAGEGARFRMPFVPLGIVPEGASTLLFPRLAGAKRAADLLLLGREF